MRFSDFSSALVLHGVWCRAIPAGAACLRPEAHYIPACRYTNRAAIRLKGRSLLRCRDRRAWELNGTRNLDGDFYGRV
jgi:hypothetical protein